MSEVDEKVKEAVTKEDQVEEAEATEPIKTDVESEKTEVAESEKVDAAETEKIEAAEPEKVDAAEPEKTEAAEPEKTNTGKKFCTNCGEPLKPGQKFCGNCGMKFDVKEIKPEGATASGVKMPAFDMKKKPIVFIIAGVAVVILLIALIGGGSSKNFAKKYGSWSSESWCTIGDDGSYIQLDTNPLDLDDHYEPDALDAIKKVNNDLGFGDSVTQQMLQTSALMGRQTAESKEATVSWSYHPDHGLVAFYEWKK